MTATEMCLQKHFFVAVFVFLFGFLFNQAVRKEFFKKCERFTPQCLIKLEVKTKWYWLAVKSRRHYGEYFRFRSRPRGRANDRRPNFKDRYLLVLRSAGCRTEMGAGNLFVS